MELSEILSRCDHTLLRTDAGSAEIRQLCDEAVKYGCASVCIPPCHVPGAKKYLAGRVPVCTVIGFPNGYMTTAAKAFEAADAVAKGADEVDMVINLATYQVTIEDEPVDLTLMEYSLLSFLATHPNRAYSREVLLHRVWGFEYCGGTRTVDVHIRRIRSKVGPLIAAHITTVRGVGYLFKE